jgi:tripartite-type tricarboxylate transporter receptor subunit TctC
MIHPHIKGKEKKMKKAALIFVVLCLTAGMVFAAGTKEAKFPTKPITIVCPWSAGGGTDRVARYLAELMSKEVGQPVNVVNKTGGSGAVGHGEGANAAPDGYTIMNLTFEINVLKYLGYADLTPENYIPLLQFNEDAPAVIVSAKSPYTSVKDLIDDIKAKPEGTFKFSGSTIASAWDLPRIRMLMAAGISPAKVKYIPTQGAAPAITELLGGHVDVITCSYPEAAGQIEGGALKALAIMSDERNKAFDKIPTLKEQGINVSGGTWRGFAVPLKTPEPVVQYLISTLQKVTASQEYKDFMAKNGFGVRIRVGKEFGDFMMTEYRALKDVMEAAGYLKK